MMKLFGTNGIRGISNDDLNCLFCLKVGVAIGKTFDAGPIAIAMDTRKSSDMIRSVVSAGVMSMGHDIINLGMLPTPALQYYVKTHDEIKGGIMITASHNPPEYNGIKCISADGTECSQDEERNIEMAFDENHQVVHWDRIGSETIVKGADESYIESIISKIDTDLIKKAKLTVCIDCSNGAACFTTPSLLKRMGVNVIAINSTPDGLFPGHESEPIEANLSELKRITVEHRADLGAAHDGDADRCVFVTGDGKYLTGDISLAILSKDAIKRTNGSKKVVTTVATSSLITEVTTESGGEVLLTAVGSPLVARKMMECDGIIGGEDNGGIIFADHQYCRDGAMALARMIENIARNGSLEKQVNDLPKYHTVKIVLKCENHKKQMILSKIINNHQNDRINDLDGVRIEYDDGWVILRPSGTEPKFRITSESKDENIANKRANLFKEEYENIYGGIQ